VSVTNIYGLALTVPIGYNEDVVDIAVAVPGFLQPSV
jgi:hypothetical protein